MLSSAFLLGLLTAVTTVLSKTVEYDFNVTWVLANPDGAKLRPTIGINNAWPLPQIQADIGDTIVVNVLNSLGNQSTALHFHGIFMEGTPHMDGTAQVSQCAIQPGSSFQYKFQVNQPGTYWYHAHAESQYPDGLRGLLIVQDGASPYHDEYNEEIVFSISDWYHEQMPEMMPHYLHQSMLHDPTPDSNLINDTQNLQIPVRENEKYLVRIANIGGFMGQYVSIEDHEMTIVEVDGVYTKPAQAQTIYIAAGQRYGVLIEGKNNASRNYAVTVTMDKTLIMMAHSRPQVTVTGWLVYDQSRALDEPSADIDISQAIDDIGLEPYDAEPLFTSPDQSITLNMGTARLADGKSHWTFNDIAYTPPEYPTLYHALEAGALSTDAATYNQSTNTFILAENQTVELVVNNGHMSRHPFHLHGHNFQVVYRSEAGNGSFADTGATEADFPRVPIRRDTAIVHPGGNLVLRFRSTNPGVWIFHCHMEWHAYSGLVLTLVEAPLALQERMRLSTLIPADHLATCAPGQSLLSGSVVEVDEAVPSSTPTEDEDNGASSDTMGDHDSSAATKSNWNRAGAYLGFLVVMMIATGVVAWREVRRCACSGRETRYAPLRAGATGA
ncbi:multicopper oxidase [Aspergillus japonicus CBS 114.51]|uniref:Multicopper oxidase n=1 Tax=Aspergillus japonicus CBS 114.51 TaxID=1448312 RepID=A0A8T8WUY4_ASPJA|nr:multicopper oxidase [Aspergillus japonicus CBS 114.51]RAH79470.1 multicopper oxidase [Aspergillus japonicus CBS 114.51]